MQRMMKKRMVRGMFCWLLMAAMLTGCGNRIDDNGTQNGTQRETAEQTTTTGGKIYFLNFKPEQNDQWLALAKMYTQQTGVPFDVQTAASDTYESTLKSEMAKTQAPTLFQVNGPVGLSTWKDYCYDLSDSEVYAHLTSDDFALKEGTEIKAIAYVVETYGLIYNKALLRDYIDTDGAVIREVSEINSFAKLKAVADDIQAKKEDLGIEGAFTSAGMDSSSDWRFKTHLANLPVYYEYRDNSMQSMAQIQGTYLDQYKQIWDLYITDSTCSPTLLSGKTGEDAASEFALGGEEKQGLCPGSENYWCVNKNSSPEDIQATLDFLNWVITSDEGRRVLSHDMGFVTPFDTFEKEIPQNPLAKAAEEYLKEGKQPIAWTFTTMPSERWKNGVGSALLEYAQGTGSWDGVKTAFVDGWAKEYAASGR